MRYLPVFLLLLSGIAYADMVHIDPEPVDFNDPVLPKLDIPIIQESTPIQVIQSLVEGEGAESAINRALIAQDWQTLTTLLASYSTQADYDQTLYTYATGAMRRSQGRYDEAIALYQKIIKDNPSLHYPRFDLGVMLFENRAYQEAKQHIQMAYPHLGENMQALADRYLLSIEDRQAYKPNIFANFEKTDNVNNAAYAKTIEFGGATWQKTKDSLPKKATGIRYGMGVNRELNAFGHHFIYGELNAGGVHYWDNKDYNEQSLKATLGYKHHTANQTVFVLPYLEQNWVANRLYNKLYGVGFGVSQNLNDSTKLKVGVGYGLKRFDESKAADQYNSTTATANAMVIKVQSPAWTVYGGIEGGYENARQPENGSKRAGVLLGSINQMGDVGIRGNVSYAHRKFNAPSTGLVYYGSVRADHEYGAQLALWHNKIAYKGLMPQLNIRYQKVDSNQSGFYSKESLGGFVSVERVF